MARNTRGVEPTRPMDFDRIYGEMKRTAGRLSRLDQLLASPESDPSARGAETFFGKIDPSLSPDFPLLVSVCGGGNSGKSTLVNSLIGQRVAPTGGTAGLTRRPLICGHPDLWANESFVRSLFHCFPEGPKPMDSPQDLVSTGCPLYVETSRLPVNLLILDTPDFDTGSQDAYTNRAIVEPILEASHILIYIFTNANYANKDNTDFIRAKLNRIGLRDVILIYRVAAALDDKTVLKHLEVVSRNLYPEAAEAHIRGMYRADESNEVVAGQAFTSARPVGGSPPLNELLAGLDPRAIREAQSRSAVGRFIEEAEERLDEYERSRNYLEIYWGAARIACGRAVLESLRVFPQESLLDRVYHHHAETAPQVVRYLRLPGQTIRRAGGKLRRWLRMTQQRRGDERSGELVKTVQTAANHFYSSLCARELTTTASLTDPQGKRLFEAIQTLQQQPGVHGLPKPSLQEPNAQREFRLHVPRHPAVLDQIEALRQVRFEERMARIKDEAWELFRIPQDPQTPFEREFDDEIRQLVIRNRQGLPFFKRMPEYFFAAVDIGLVSGALTYVVFTGDVVSGTAVGSAKVTGLFGLNDLAALLVFPAEVKLGRVERHFLSSLLQKWLDDRLVRMQEVFDRHLSGSLLKSCEERMQEVDGVLGEAREAVQTIRREWRHGR